MRRGGERRGEEEGGRRIILQVSTVGFNEMVIQQLI
jgi:hypothetical protein